MIPHTLDDARQRSRRALFIATLFAALLANIVAALPAPIPGDHDPAFTKVTSLAIGAGDDHLYASAVQPDGKILLAGGCLNSGGSYFDLCVARLKSDGSLDANFTGPGGLATGKFSLPFADAPPGDNWVAAIALQPDGKILLAGSCPNGLNVDFCIARLNSNGSLDTTFGGPSGLNGGQFLLPVGNASDFATTVALQPDGKIVISGECFGQFKDDFCVVRLNPNGSLDTTFVGPNGNGNGKALLSIGGLYDAANAVVVQPDGKLVLAGVCGRAGNVNEFCAARLNADGSLDLSFVGPAGTGSGQFAFAVGGAGDTLTSMLLQPDGNIVLTGLCNGATTDFCAARLLAANGAFDSSFVGPAGNGNSKFLVPIGTATDNASGAALQADGKILLAGKCFVSPFFQFCAARLNGDGSLDSSFDGPSGTGNGKTLLSMGSGNNLGASVLVQPDGKIVVAGYCSNGLDDDFCVARLNGGPYAYKNCSMDIDGDGKVLASTDALMLARAALGMTGSAVIAGAVGSGATRTTWPQIRDYLVSQCGMTVAP